MKKLLFLALISLSIIACKNKQNGNTTISSTDTTQISSQQQPDNNIQTNIQYLTIEGNQIWVRSQPKTGDVILKLDEGTKCEVLGKGEEQTINNVTDFWYKISYDGQIGWVFGSQTSLKQDTPNITSTNTNQAEIGNVLNDILNNLKSENYDALKNYFINDSVFILQNPGAMVIYSTSYYKKALNNISVSSFNNNLSFETFPTYDMDTYNWSEQGYFVKADNNSTVLSSLTKYNSDFYTTAIIQKATKYEKYITYELLIAENDGIYFYLGKVNNQWKIIAIDVSTNDA